MFTDEEEKLARFRDLTEIMAKAPRKKTPEGFTAQVMARLPEGKGAVRIFSFLRPFWTPVFTTDLTLGFRRPVTKTECAFYFFLTGFFYLVLGFIMMFGLQRLTAGLPVSGWLEIQPVFSLLAALCLIALGVALYMDGDAAIRVARIGTMLYAAVVILNGWTGAISTHVPAAVFFSTTFAAAGVVMAAFLGIAVDRYAPETISSQGVRA
ncbi:MAG: hypothetical protein WCJ37_04205 [Syntrophus sp. (in: bacteria)]